MHFLIFQTHVSYIQSRAAMSPVPALKILHPHLIMVNLALVLTWLAVSGIIVGIVFPKKSLFWYHGKRSRKNALLIYSLLLLLSFILFAITE